jgi:glucosyl-3-phosphoglycerate synthase
VEGNYGLDELIARKKASGLAITVCMPARNEEPTVGSICEAVGHGLLEPGLVDQLVVMDSRSTDGTAEVARRAGAEVHSVTDVLPDIPGRDGGKGEALWKSLAVARGDLIVWMDSDTRNFTPEFVVRLLEPLIEHPELVMVKGFYERPLAHGDRMLQSGGARVTELVARPLLSLFYPELTPIVQPLSGEYAVRTEIARALPFLTGYAPDIGLLICIAEEYGTDRIAQADLGTRIHRNQDILSLGRMGHQVMQGMLQVFDDFGRVKLVEELPTTLTQFVPTDEEHSTETFDLAVVELPRMASVLKRHDIG